MDDNQEKLKSALRQWRESLVNMGGRNRLLNYRPTRSSTLEFVRHTPEEVFDLVSGNDGVFALGTKPPAPARVAVVVDESDDDESQLEDQVLDVIESFNYDAFPAQLFADKTQREVDRALKNLANAAKREFLDKGLNILYIAFGALKWVDDSGDSRRSPLLFVPVELRSDGPRQPHRLYFSSEDRAGNPALALKLREFGLELPAIEVLDEAIEASGLSAALDLFRALQLPEGWEVEELAALSNFMFAKEAMFRDLENNEDRILESPILNVIANSQSGLVEQFAFDMLGDDRIDESAPPESAPLVLDADSSQRAAIAAAREGKSFVLDGPPGTGKSQTIANIIAALISDGKRVLFVSEKVVALDVVRDRLNERGLGFFLFELHSHRAVRSEVAARLAGALDVKPVPVGRPKPITRMRSTELRGTLNDYADAMNEVRAPLELTVHEVLGSLEAIAVSGESPAPVFAAKELHPTQLAEITKEAVKAADHWAVIRRGNNDPWWGLEETESLRYDLDTARDALRALHQSLEAVLPGRRYFGLEATSKWKRAVELLAVWNRNEGVHSPDWLLNQDVLGLSNSVDEYARAVVEFMAVDSATQVLCGPNWRDSPIPTINRRIDTSLATVLPGAETLRLSELEQARSASADGAAIVSALIATAAVLSELVGLRAPQFIAGFDAFGAAIHAVLMKNRPNAEWLTSQEALDSVRDGARGLRESIQDEMEAAASAREYFTDGIQALDVTALSVTVKASASFTRRFGREAKEVRRTIAGVSSGSAKMSVLKLPLASTWQDARETRSSLETQFAHLLGRYSVADKGWSETEQAFEAAQIILSSAEILDPLALHRALNDDATRALSAAQAELLIGQLAHWRTVASAGILHVPLEIGEGAPDAARLLMMKSEREASRIEDELRHIVAGLDIDPPIGQAWDSAQARIDANAEVQQFEAIRARLAPTLALAGTNVGTEQVSALKDKLKWTRDVQAAVADNGAVRVLTNDQLAALSTANTPDGVAADGGEWELRLAALKNHFASPRADLLESELEDRLRGDIHLGELLADGNGPESWLAANAARTRLTELGIGNVVDALLRSDVAADVVADRIEQATLRHWVNHYLRHDSRLVGKFGENRDDLVTEFRKIDRELIDDASNEIVQLAVSRRPKTGYGQSALIRREGEKKRRHIAVRELVDQARDVIQAIHPCFMMSPLAVSQYLPSDIEFDVVIFDEASQVTPGDAINCIYRGKALITAGDQRQLPPTSFFAAGIAIDEDDDEDDLANDYESILDLMKSSGGFNTMTLRWHYRSRHEHLIAYSNHSFYEGRLVTFPGAIDEDENLGVKFYLIDGVYRRSNGQDNPKEALAVAQRVINHFDTRPQASLGVVAFSAAQRDSIDNAITVARSERPDLDRFFQDDRLDGLFVKSLEEVQGDERDVIILSIGYGPDESGKVYRNFGPINRKGGERRLNVAITRARRLVEVVSSMTASQIGETASEGSRHLRRYLDFAERGTKALTLELGSEGRGTDSPFEDSVIDAIRSWGYEVQPQVGVAGFRIDIGVKHPDAPGVFMLGVECDGAMYHSSRTARDRDRLRHEVLEGLGWQIHHIWGTAWYRNRDREIARLKELLESRSKAPISGRLVARQQLRKLPNVVEERDSSPVSVPEWLVPYKTAEREHFPLGIELGETANAHRIVPFVQRVVEAESPVHFEVLSTRLRETAGIGRVGHRIRATLQRAVQLADVEVDGDFLMFGTTPLSEVRTSSPFQARSIDQVHSRELELAVHCVVRDAAGASRPDVVEAVSRALGWNRTSVAIAAVIAGAIDRLVAAGDLREADLRLTIGKH